jgi:hypothetical protein
MPEEIVPAADATDNQAPPPCPTGQRLAEVLLIFLVFFVVGGEPVPHVNEPHYLCRLKHAWNPDWCAGDLFLESTDAHLVFVWAFAWFTEWLSLTALAWLGRVAVWLALAWAWQRLSWQLVPKAFCAVLSAATWLTLIAQGHLAGEWVVGGLEAKCIAYVAVLCGLKSLVAGRWNRMWIELGVASALHVLVGGWSTLVGFGIWVFHERPHVRFRQMLPGLAAGGAIALAGVLPAVLLTRGQTPDIVAEANRIYVFERLAHHLAPLTLPTAEIVDRIARHALLLVGLFALGKAVRPQLGLTRIRWFAWGAVALAGGGFLIELLYWNNPLAAARLLKYYWFRLTDIGVPLAVALHVTALIAWGLARHRVWAVWLLAVVLAATSWQLASTAVRRATHPVPPADRSMRDVGAWIDVCDWAAKHTRPDALFLTPRLAHSFKWRAGRAEVVTRKDIPQDAPSVVEWLDRLHDVHYYQFEGEWYPYRSLAHGGTGRVERIAAKYHADYIVTDTRRRLGLPVVYRNEHYVVYATGQP